jgi:uncharacterized membrane protein YebE (DUF533 family)
MTDINQILGKLLGSNLAGGFAGGLAGGLASNVLTSKSGRKMGKNALKMGGVAAVGALAYAAYQRYAAGNEKTSGVLNVPRSEAPSHRRPPARPLCRPKAILPVGRPWG